MKTSHITRILAVGFLATASAFALTAPAQADPPPFHQLVQAAGASGETPGDAVRPDDRATRVTAPLGQQSAAVRPDDRADRPTAALGQSASLRPAGWAFRELGTGSQAIAIRPDDRADRSLPSSIPALPTTADRFDWVDAGVGAAAGALGLVLLMTGAMMLGQRLRRITALT